MKKRTDRQKNIILIIAIFIAAISMILFFILNSRNNAGTVIEDSMVPYVTPSPSADPTNSDTGSAPHTQNSTTGTGIATASPSPTQTEIVIDPGTDAPVYIGVSSQIDIESANNDYIASLVKEKLMEKGFFKVDSGKLDSDRTNTEAFEILWYDDYVKVRIRTSAETQMVTDLYKEFLTLVYDNGARKHTWPAGENPGQTPSPTPVSSTDPYAFLTINIYLAEM